MSITGRWEVLFLRQDRTKDYICWCIRLSHNTTTAVTTTAWQPYWVSVTQHLITILRGKTTLNFAVAFFSPSTKVKQSSLLLEVGTHSLAEPWSRLALKVTHWGKVKSHTEKKSCQFPPPASLHPDSTSSTNGTPWLNSVVAEWHIMMTEAFMVPFFTLFCELVRKTVPFSYSSIWVRCTYSLRPCRKAPAGYFWIFQYVPGACLITHSSYPAPGASCHQLTCDWKVSRPHSSVPTLNGLERELCSCKDPLWPGQWQLSCVLGELDAARSKGSVC